MKKILILFAHPRFEQSRINKALIEAASQVNDVTIHDLYERYPNFNINIPFEQSLLDAHDVVVWHHPFYWYSCPPLLKQWIDLVLEYNWAYGPKGNALNGKLTLNALTAGGTRQVYCEEGRNRYSVSEFLRPFEQTARLCGMEYLPPFAVLGTHRITPEALKDHQHQYINLLTSLKQGMLETEPPANCQFLNDLEMVQKPAAI